MTVFSATYDLAKGPVSYDFASWLINADMARAAAGAASLHAVIVPKQDGVDGWFRDKLSLYDAAEMHWRLRRIVLPLCLLIGATVELVPPAKAAARRAVEPMTIPYVSGPTVLAARAGARVPMFEPCEHARRAVRALHGAAPIVTMTLRDTYEPARNADRAAWRLAEAHIARSGYTVVCVDDTSVALRQGSGFYELDVELRAALYERAALNLHCNGGPSVLSWFMRSDFVGFGYAVGPAWADHWGKAMSLAIGEQFPWCGPRQRLVYEVATGEVIVREFERWTSSR